MSKQSEKPIIGTHSGQYVLACYILHQTKQFRGAEIIRTRDANVLKTCTILVDVGSIYDPQNLRFDHHQRDFSGTFNDKFQTKLSSAGLIYKHFGKEVVQQETDKLLVQLKMKEMKLNKLSEKKKKKQDNESNENNNSTLSSADLLRNNYDTVVDLVYEKLYHEFIEAIDATDNGIEQYPHDITPKYKNTTHLTSRIRRLNPSWNDASQHTDNKFKKAMEIAGAEFMEYLSEIVLSWLPAREIVERAVDNRLNIHPSGEIIQLESLCPWQEHLFLFEAQMKLEPTIKFVLFKAGFGMWRVQGVPVRIGSFQTRIGLPESWRGLNDEKLVQECGIPNSVYAHHNGWIGGNKSWEGALEMARKALEKRAASSASEEESYEED